MTCLRLVVQQEYVELEMVQGAARHAALLQDGLFPIEAEIVERLHTHAVDLANSSPIEWTSMVKEQLGKLADQQGVLQFPNKLPGQWEKGGEWLFDVTWVKAKRNQDGEFDWRSCHWLALACESEWLTGEYCVLEDFLKLTLVVADLRLFVYTNSTVDGMHPVELCKRACPQSRGFRYLTIGFPGSESTCRVDAWTA